jgi:hypothetical protein
MEQRNTERENEINECSKEVKELKKQRKKTAKEIEDNLKRADPGGHVV